MPQINTLLNVQEALGKRRPFRVRYIAVGGGGGAASASLSDPVMGAGGGGGGGVITGSYIPQKNDVYPIVVGNGGGPETNGIDTVLFDTTALGGGAGRRSNQTGSNGGSGGGGGVGGVGLQPTASYTGAPVDEHLFAQYGNNGGSMIQPSFQLEFLAVAGGGGGNIAATTGNGGGGGGVITGSFFPNVLQTYDIIVGNGGAPGLTIPGNPPQPSTGFIGDNTSLFGTTALGGGGAGGTSDELPIRNRNGGSGGGGGGIALQPTASYSGFGNNGAISGDGAGGGGAGAPGSGRNGGNGIALDFTGTTALYGPGGRGTSQAAGNGTNGAGIYGNGGQGAFANLSVVQPTSGSAGGVIIKYAGVPKAVGGTITESNGFTFHTYTSPGTSSFQLIATAGGGGGAAEPGFDSLSFVGGNGGDGIEINAYLTPLKYAPGGAGFCFPSGSGIDGEGVYGAGGTAGLIPESGSAGVAIIRYESAVPRATGGTITQNNRFIYHLFETGSADFTWLG